MKKKIISINKPRAPHFVGDGFRVHNFIPQAGSRERLDPFLLLDYNSPYTFPPSTAKRGVDVHPHRGFETVTIAYKGSVSHHDSAGGGGTIQAGDVQWMTAGSGILHKEYHSEDFSNSGGDFQMVQLWVNLPAVHKMTAPRYQTLKKDQLSRVNYADAEVEVIAGQVMDVKGPAKTFSPVELYNVRLRSGGSIDLTMKYAGFMLVIEGEINLEGVAVSRDHFVVLGEEGEDFRVSASQDAIVLVGSGAPLHEPIVAHGPFVMNSKEEIMQAFQDFNLGKFGYLED